MPLREGSKGENVVLCKQNRFCSTCILIFIVLVSMSHSQTQHRVGIRTTGATTQFFDKDNGHKFIPRGADYLQFGWDDNVVVERLFSPQYYDLDRIQRSIRHMRDLVRGTPSLVLPWQVFLYIFLHLQECNNRQRAVLRERSWKWSKA